MKLGYMARSQHGTTYHLTNPKKSPRAQLLLKCGSKHADRMYVDNIDGISKQRGYIVGREWFTIYEVHDWAAPDKPRGPCGSAI